MKRLHIGVDVGGTFTDVVVLDDQGRSHYTKVPSTGQDPSVGVVAGLQQALAELGAEPAALELFVHGTTVATNALLERRGARVALLTTAGFRDVLHIGRQSRPHLYELWVHRPEPLVPRRLRLEVHERTGPDGAVDLPLDPGEVARLVAACREQGVQALAICFLHSYANPANERAAAAAARAAVPDLPVSASSDILPEFREFERMNTTVLNAYVQPVVASYVRTLAGRLVDQGVRAPLLVMRSNGGVAEAPRAAATAVHTLLSGPAGGVLGGSFLAEATGVTDLVTADVGGTSFDVALIAAGRPSTRTEGVLEGYPVKFPHLDIHTIGAGGGSIAWLDRAGGLRVGPRSAGAEPGPVCYGRGGLDPTVTDGHAVLGRVAGLLGGRMHLDVEAARRVVAERLGGPLGLTPEAAADGILRVVNAAMSRAIRVMTVERGIDPRRFTLLAFGGAGPLHAADLARSLGMSRVLIPPAPGNFSAWGLLAAPLREDRSGVLRGRVDELAPERVAAALADLQAEAAGALRSGELGGAMAVRCEFAADLRYVGQAFELTVPLPGDLREAWAGIAAAYHHAHATAYGFSRRDDPVELVVLRATAFAQPVRPRWEAGGAAGDAGAAPPRARRPVWFAGAWTPCAFHLREDLRAGQRLAGPAIVEEHGATTVLHPQDTAEVDAWGNLRLAVGPTPGAGGAVPAGAQRGGSHGV